MSSSPRPEFGPLWLRLAIPIVGVAMMTAVRLTAFQAMTAHFPTSLFIIPVIIATWCGGAKPGIFAAVLGIGVSALLPPPYNLELNASLGLTRLILFATVSGVCILIIGQLHIARARAEVELRERKRTEADLLTEVAFRKQAEADLAAALQRAEEASEAKTDFVANMSHEIRTPMNAIVGLAGILAKSEPLTEKQKKFVETLSLSARTLLDLVNDMLDMSKIEANIVELQSVPFNLKHLCEEVLNILGPRAKEKGLHLIIDDQGLLLNDFAGDPPRIKQILMNLCSNAIKFTSAGLIAVSLTSMQRDDETDWVCLAVKDTGIGIPPDQLETIFGKFVQGDATINRRYGGTGLGLAIAKSLTEMMGGTIAVESRHAAGSVFTVTLPLKRATNTYNQPSLTHEAAEPLPAFRARGKKILLVEDNDANILVAGSFLEQFGFEFDVARDGAEALERLKTGQYLAALMDIRMPGLDGLETTRLIRRNERQFQQKPLHIIGVTANALPEDRAKCIQSGMDDYMPKPIDPVKLEARLKQLYSDNDNFTPPLQPARRI